MRRPLKLGLGLVFAVSLFGAASSSALAQGDIMEKHIATLELTQADVREAIRSVFKNIDASYSIAPDVQGQVTVSLKDVTVEVALQNILRQVDATYRFEGGVYEIVKRSQQTVAPVNPSDQTFAGRLEGPTIRRIKIRSADPAFIAMMLGAKKGNQNYDLAPEYSTIVKTQGAGRGGSGGGFGGGIRLRQRSR